LLAHDGSLHYEAVVVDFQTGLALPYLPLISGSTCMKSEAEYNVTLQFSSIGSSEDMGCSKNVSWQGLPPFLLTASGTMTRAHNLAPNASKSWKELTAVALAEHNITGDVQDNGHQSQASHVSVEIVVIVCTLFFSVAVLYILLGSILSCRFAQKPLAPRAPTHSM